MSFPISISFQVSAPPTGAFESLARSAQSLDKAMLGTAANFDKFGSSVSQMESPLSGVSGSMSQLEGSMGSLEGSLSGAAGSMGEFAGSTDQLNGSISETGGFVTEATGAMGEFGGSATEAGGAATEFGTAATEAGTGATELGTASTDAGTGVTELGTATGETNTALGETNTVLGETVPAMAETATGATDLGTAASELVPPLQDTNSALGDSIPIFEGAGTAAEESAGSTDTFTGALGNLDAGIDPVNGGLTETNTLMGDVGGAAETTSGSTDTLHGSMTTLGTGIGAVTGSALTLYSAFTNIRDAQAAVEKAQIKVIDANRKAESAFIKLGSAINKITSDTENNITGTDRLAAAYAKLAQLWNAGIRSGPEFAAALNELKAAQDGLASSTAKGNEMIAKLGPNISTVESTSRKAASSALGLQRANEGVAESYLGFAGSIVSGVSGLTQIITQAGQVASKFGPLKGIFTAAGTALSSSLVPALGAIAAPAAAAVAAVAAFIGAVTAIRVNMKVFDDLGQKVGEVFPSMKGFLDEARQAFINLSDGINTGISMLLGAFDGLTGGTLNLQKQWDGFTGTLAKGTGEMGLAARAANLWTLAMDKSGNVIRVGAGKWKEADGVLMRLNGSVLAAAGTWDQLADGTAVYMKQAEKVPPVQKATTATTEQMSAATKKASDELAGIGTKVEEANAKFAFYGESAKLAELMTNSFALGVANAKVELIDQTAKLAEGAGALQEHGNQMASGALQALAYKQGILEAGEALVEKVQALHQAEGAYDATNVLIKEGTILAVEFAAGMQETKSAIQEQTLELQNLAGQLAAYSDEMTAANAVANAFTEGMLKQRKAAIDAALGYAEAVGKLTELQQQIKSGTTAVIGFNTGLVEGRTKALQFALGLAESVGEAAAFESTLRKLAVAAGVDLQSALQMSEEQLKLLLSAMAMAPDAVNKVISAFDKMGQKIVDSLAKAAREGSDAFMDEIDKLQDELGVTFSKPLIQKLQVEADIEVAKQDVQKLLGILATTLRNQPLDIALRTDAAQNALALLQQKIREAPAGAQQAFAPLQAALTKLGAWKPSDGMNQLPGILAQILIASQNLEGGMQGAIAGFNGLVSAVGSSAGGLNALKSALAAVNLNLNTTTGTITDASGKIVGELGKIGPAAGAMGQQTVAALDTLGPAGTKARTTLAFELVGLEFLMNRFAQEVKQSAIEVSTAFSNMAANTRTSLNTMASGFAIVIAAFARIQTDSQRMATTVSGSFSNMAANTRSSMTTMASGFQVVIAAMTRISSGATSMNSTVSGAMRSMTSSASSFASGMSSSMSRASSAMATATSRANSLRSAINSLRSKTITITTVYVTIRRTLFAAAGGAFVTSSPTKVGPMSVSEFGQAELVSVTPLQTPGRQPVKGISNLIKGETEKRTRRMLDEEKEKGTGEKGKEMVMVRETPIIIQVDGREITRVVSKRIFEESDSLV